LSSWSHVEILAGALVACPLPLSALEVTALACHRQILSNQPAPVVFFGFAPHRPFDLPQLDTGESDLPCGPGPDR